MLTSVDEGESVYTKDGKTCVICLLLILFVFSIDFKARGLALQRQNTQHSNLVLKVCVSSDHIKGSGITGEALKCRK